MKSLKLNASNIDTAAGIAATAMLADGVVIHPTDTVYGLGCDATSERAVRRVMKLKQRPDGVPFIVLFPNISVAAEWTEPRSSRAVDIMARCWSLGPITYVVRSNARARSGIVGCGETLAMRIPGDLFCGILCGYVSKPVLSTSANVHGDTVAASTHDMPRDLLEGVDLVIDGGTLVGAPSTIIDLATDTPRILRAGSVSRADIVNVLGPDLIKD